jgi:thiamine pyrophosphate-dependent acetolactate synthase large subunit-like protein
MAVALHSNVGLMHATMAIFNAWCDRIPILMVGGVGPIDAVKRRPWVDWIHTSRDLGALIRDYIKWDDLPGSVPAALESIVRAHRIAMTHPRGPTYVALDAGMQEEALAADVPMPPLDRFPLPSAASPSPQALRDAVALLRDATKPLVMIGRVSNSPDDWHARVALAERLGAIVLTDIKTGASFPTAHPRHPFAPRLYVTGAAAHAIRDADVILSLDWIDLGGTVRQACEGTFPAAKVISCSLDEYIHNGWNMDYQALPPTALSLLCPPDRLVARLLDRLPERVTGSAASRASGAPAGAGPRAAIRSTT